MQKNNYRMFVLSILSVILLAIVSVGHHMAFAHCDTIDGSVIQAAKKALETGVVTPVLMWVQEKDEEEIKEAFERARAVRKLSPQAKELADMYFFETLVRIHRAGEGAPYTGLKPAGSEVHPAVVKADKALESGSVDNLIKEISGDVASGIRERFDWVTEKKKHMQESVAAGREYVEAYVQFIHYVERISLAASDVASHHSEAEPIDAEHIKQ